VRGIFIYNTFMGGLHYNISYMANTRNGKGAFTYQVTYRLSEADSCTYGQEISCFCENRSFIAVFTTDRHVSPFHPLTPYFLNIRFNIILSCTLPHLKWSFTVTLHKSTLQNLHVFW
jgi:hypothetical protein